MIFTNCVFPASSTMDKGSSRITMLVVLFFDAIRSLEFSQPSELYSISDGTYTWDSALDYCIDNGGSLAVVDTDEVDTYLRSNYGVGTGKESFWIGLTDQATNGVFVWTNGQVLNRAKWKDGNPSHTAIQNGDGIVYEHCVRVDVNGWWDDVACGGNEHKAICQTLPKNGSNEFYNEFYCNRDEDDCVPWMQKPLTNMWKVAAFQMEWSKKKITASLRKCTHRCATSVTFRCSAIVYDNTTKECFMFETNEQVNTEGPVGPEEAEYYMREFEPRKEDKSSINFLPQVDSWDRAKLKCELENTRLLTSYTAEKHLKLFKTASWLSLTDRDVEGVFKWDDGSYPFFEQWKKGYPSGSKQNNCAYRNENGSWIDLKCSLHKIFYCEYTEIMKPCVENGFRCLNGATCQNVGADFTCLCIDDFTGEVCETKSIEKQEEEIMKPCVEFDFRCLNGAMCQNFGANFTCLCFDDFTGEFCETKSIEKQEEDPCLSEPCKNDATCINDGQAFRCNCTEGFIGMQCEVVNANAINRKEFLASPCGLYPCQNGGRCQSESLDSYECICPRDYYGQNCEEELVLVYTYIMLRFKIDYNEDYKSMMSDASRQFKSVIMREIRPVLIEHFEHALFANVILIREGSVIATLEVASTAQEKSLNKGQIEVTARKAIMPVVLNGILGIYPVDPTSVNITVAGTDKDNCLYVHEPCKNGGDCYDAVGHYFCMCTFYYTGQHCEQKIDIQGYGKGNQNVFIREGGGSNKTRDPTTDGSTEKHISLLLLLLCLVFPVWLWFIGF